MIQDVVAGVRALLEPDPSPAARTIAIDETGAKPLVWEAGEGGTLYVYPSGQEETPIESGPTVRQDFELLAVLVTKSREEADLERDPAISAFLDGKADDYSRALRQNQHTVIWDHIGSDQAVRPPATLQTRAVALRIRGYRLVN